MSSIKIKIAPGGKTTSIVTGAPGGACREVSKPYNNAFAGQEVSDTPTDEALEPEVTTTEDQHEQQY